MKVIITITDSTDLKSCKAEVHFDPPFELKRGEMRTPAEHCAALFFKSIEEEASTFKVSSLVTQDAPKKKGGSNEQATST